MNFNEEQVISSVLIQFQGGFVGQDCHIEITKPNENEVSIHPFYPEDVNTPQEFLLEPTKVKVVRVIFKKSTDFFGRIVIYNLCFRFV